LITPAQNLDPGYRKEIYDAATPYLQNYTNADSVAAVMVIGGLRDQRGIAKLIPLLHSNDRSVIIYPRINIRCSLLDRF
jgi:hypothetical protein